ncbi:hypothetical protein OPV22_027370 [Ensete ventricosum]|uniref:Uncharacterized protein n=1 Tax=Ensete ventricosum TaxID=4639 RepID=A0AAV8Q3K4_ENSVE|nr:hypothetical protein OPV22_027370 [Ensete ventricosum]
MLLLFIRMDTSYFSKCDTFQSVSVRCVCTGIGTAPCLMIHSTQWLVGAIGPKLCGYSWTLHIVSTLEPRHQQQPYCSETRSHGDGGRGEEVEPGNELARLMRMHPSS